MRMPTSVLVRDALVAAALTLATQVELVAAGDRVAGSPPAQHLAFALMTGSVALRRTSPVAAAVVCAVGTFAQESVGDAPVAGGFVALLIVTLSLGYHASWRAGVVGLAALAVGGLGHDVIVGPLVVGDLVANTLIVVGAWLLAHVLRVNVERRVAAEVERDRAARDAVAAERTRIARDLHDSVAHALTVVSLHAGGARELAEGEAVRESLGHIEWTSRQALADMHRFLRVLGADADEAPGIGDLDVLFERVASAGVAVTAHREGDLGTLPASVSTTVYRVVQEGLTNVLRHSGAGAADVVVTRSGGGVRVRVVDAGGDVVTRQTVPVAGSGRGLAGLRERVGLFGGEVSAAPVPGGGWQVDASIPVEGST